MKIANGLSRQLLKAVLSIYFVITLIVTMTQMGVEYLHTRTMIQSELASAEKTFYPALATALWELNTEQLFALQQGIVDLPLISSIRIVDASGQEVLKPVSSSHSQGAIEHVFKVSYFFAGQDVYLADVYFVAAGDVIFDRLKLGYQMILISALIKSLALTLLFVWMFRRRLGIPLGQLTAAVAAIDLASLGRSRIDLAQTEENELSKLEAAFNHMLHTLDVERRAHDASLDALNKSLEIEVAKRTAELEAANRCLEHLVRTDPLTGAANRRHFFEQADIEISRARRAQVPLSLLMIDLDNFKRVNDSFGHAAGDEVLKNFVSAASGPLRAADLLARVGGEEFTVLLPETGLDGAHEVARRLLETIRQQAVDFSGKAIRYTVSIGVATLGQEEVAWEPFVARADAALYRAKADGRDCVALQS